jgi:hypothetical protein
VPFNIQGLVVMISWKLKMDISGNFGIMKGKDLKVQIALG